MIDITINKTKVYITILLCLLTSILCVGLIVFAFYSIVSSFKNEEGKLIGKIVLSILSVFMAYVLLNCLLGALKFISMFYDILNASIQLGDNKLILEKNSYSISIPDSDILVISDDIKIYELGVLHFAFFHNSKCYEILLFTKHLYYNRTDLYEYISLKPYYAKDIAENDERLISYSSDNNKYEIFNFRKSILPST